MLNWDKALYVFFSLMCLIAIMEIYDRIKLKIVIRRSQKRVLKNIMKEMENKKNCKKKDGKK